MFFLTTDDDICRRNQWKGSYVRDGAGGGDGVGGLEWDEAVDLEEKLWGQSLAAESAALETRKRKAFMSDATKPPNAYRLLLVPERRLVTLPRR